MPERVAQVIDVRTSPVSERITAINDFVDAGYEVDINFSPVIVYDGWQTDYLELFENLDETLSAQAKEQLKAEVFFLTHNAALTKLTYAGIPEPRTGCGAPSCSRKSSAKTACGTCATKSTRSAAISNRFSAP